MICFYSRGKDWLCLDRLTWGTIQWGTTDKSGGGIICIGGNRERQPDTWPYLCCASLLRHFTRHCLVYTLLPHHMVCRPIFVL